jgi:hypothetical protein
MNLLVPATTACTAKETALVVHPDSAARLQTASDDTLKEMMALLVQEQKRRADERQRAADAETYKRELTKAKAAPLVQMQPKADILGEFLLPSCMGFLCDALAPENETQYGALAMWIYEVTGWLPGAMRIVQGKALVSLRRPDPKDGCQRVDLYECAEFDGLPISLWPVDRNLRWVCETFRGTRTRLINHWRLPPHNTP